MFFDVKGEPKGDPRPRRAGNRPGVYKPPTADGWKDAVREAAMTEASALPVSPPIGFCVAVVFRMPRPKAHWRTGKRAGELKPWAPYWHVAKPDLDNLLKSTLDAIGCYPKGAAPLVWVDDAQVCYLLDPIKRYVLPGEQPGATIGIFQLQAEQ